MPAFTTFNNRLPDPTFIVNDAGAQAVAGKFGPGFANVTVRSKKDTQVSRTNSGRGVMREQGAHVWEIDINYHPMLRNEFDVVQTFLDARNARMYPFYVVLPQHSKPKNTTFATTVLTVSVKTMELKPAGSSYVVLDLNDSAIAFGGATGYPSPGDFINFDDPTDINHQKAYKITRVETQTDFNNTLPGVVMGGTNNRVRIHFSPPLVRSIPNDCVVRFTNPTFRVIAKADVFEYALNTDNLYQFSLQLEEILP